MENKASLQVTEHLHSDSWVFPNTDLMLFLNSPHGSLHQVYIIGHVPPGFFEKKRNKPWFMPKFNKLYLDLIKKHHSVILGQFFGHHHTDSFRMFYSSEGKVPYGDQYDATNC